MERDITKSFGLRQLVEASRRITTHLEMDQAISQVVYTLTDQLGASLSVLWLVEKGTGCEGCDMREECLEHDVCLVLKAWSGPRGGGDALNSHIPLGVMKIGRIAASRAPYISHDVLTDPMLSDPETAGTYGIRSFAGFPLLVMDRLLGVLAYYGDKPLEPELGDILACFAQQAASAIDDARKHEEILRSEERYKRLIDGALDAVLIFGPDGTILTAGQSASRHFGYDVAELQGMNIRDLDMATEKQVAGFISDLASGMTVTYDTTFKTKNGPPMAVEVKAGTTEYSGGPAILTFVRDVTERKKLERQRADLISMITHDLKSPLSIIMGYTEVIKEQHLNTLPELVKEGILSIQNSSEKLLSMVDDYLSLSRMEAGALQMDKTAVELVSILNKSMDSVVFRADEKKLELKLSCPSGLPKVKADAKYLERAVTNLLVNAVNYTPRGGSVEVSCSVDPGKDKAEITVSDTGMGICGLDLPRVFDKYYRPSSNKKKGTGLGLAIVKKVAEAHGGSVSVTSDVDVGSSFTITIPVE